MIFFVEQNFLNFMKQLWIQIGSFALLITAANGMISITMANS